MSINPDVKMARQSSITEAEAKKLVKFGCRGFRGEERAQHLDWGYMDEAWHFMIA